MSAGLEVFVETGATINNVVVRHHVMPVKSFITTGAHSVELSETPITGINWLTILSFDRCAVLLFVKLLAVDTGHVMLNDALITDKRLVAHNLERIILTQRRLTRGAVRNKRTV